jgi:hypothetical protein
MQSCNDLVVHTLNKAKELQDKGSLQPIRASDEYKLNGLSWTARGGLQAHATFESHDMTLSEYSNLTSPRGSLPEWTCVKSHENFAGDQKLPHASYIFSTQLITTVKVVRQPTYFDIQELDLVKV